jgi:hypothetical protein
VLCITLNFRKKLDKAMGDICARITAQCEGDLKLWPSDDNAEELVIKVDVEEDVFLHDIAAGGIWWAFISKEKRVHINSASGGNVESPGWFLETDGTNPEARSRLESELEHKIYIKILISITDLKINN